LNTVTEQLFKQLAFLIFRTRQCPR